jgi:hypothetical protein
VKVWITIMIVPQRGQCQIEVPVVCTGMAGAGKGSLVSGHPEGLMDANEVMVHREYGKRCGVALNLLGEGVSQAQ